MTLVIALMALAALELPGAPVHEPVHARGPMFPHPATVRNIAMPTSARAGLAIMRADGFTVRSCLHVYIANYLRK